MWVTVGFPLFKTQFSHIKLNFNQIYLIKKTFDFQMYRIPIITIKNPHFNNWNSIPIIN
jgi:hypothetical protein